MEGVLDFGTADGEVREWWVVEQVLSVGWRNGRLTSLQGQGTLCKIMRR